MYQQEDRDLRQERKRQGEEKAYGFMLRTRVPGGRLTAAQYLAHDDVASRFGNGTLRITARQDFQLHGVLKGDIVRNVVLCPRPGTGSIEHELWRHVSALSRQLSPKTHAYAEIRLDGEKVTTLSADDEEPLYGRTYLPRKFKIGVTLPWDDCIDVLATDMGLVAVADNGRVSGFNVYVGGGQGMMHNKPTMFPALSKPLAWIGPEQVVPVATAAVETFRDWGDRENRKHARIKYLVVERGIDWLRREAERRLGYPLVAPRSIELSGAHSHLGWHRQDGEHWSLGVYVESGRIADTATQHMKTAFREITTRLQASVRLSPDQNILFADIPAALRSDVEDILRQHGVSLAEHVAPVRHRAMACPALPTCGLALSEAERALPSLLQQIEGELQELGLEDAPVVRMVGCPNGCTRPYTAEIGIVGRSGDRYVLYVGGSHLGTRLGAPLADVRPRQGAHPNVAGSSSRLSEWPRERRALRRFLSPHRAGSSAADHRARPAQGQ